MKINLLVHPKATPAQIRAAMVFMDYCLVHPEGMRANMPEEDNWYETHGFTLEVPAPGEVQEWGSFSYEVAFTFCEHDQTYGFSEDFWLGQPTDQGIPIYSSEGGPETPSMYFAG